MLFVISAMLLWQSAECAPLDSTAVRVVAGGGTTTPVVWEVDTATSTLTFEVRHFVVQKVTGRLTQFDGSVSTLADVRAGQIVGRASAASVNTGNPQRDADLRSAEFFHSGMYPWVRIFSHAGETISADDKIVLDVEIRGVCRPVTFDVASRPPVGPQPALRRAWVLRGTVNRVAHGMRGYRGVVGDAVRLVIDVELVRKS
jgi:polyisoprenoid-binding protein YceI